MDVNEPYNYPVDAIHLLRTTQQHHVQLSLMADHKANMLIGATFVVFSLAVGRNAEPTLAMLVLGMFSFVAAVLAALAVMPMTSMRPALKPNWLFFGAFSKVSEEEFVEKIITNQISSSENVHRAMLRDIYQMGMVLDRKKYRYLNWAYRVFLVGITLTFLVFVLEYAYGPMMVV